MGYALFHLKSKVVIAEYDTLRSARTAMRTSNKNAGYPTRTERTFKGGVEVEWCYNGITHDYAPYAITHSSYLEIPEKLEIEEPSDTNNNIILGYN